MIHPIRKIKAKTRPSFKSRLLTAMAFGAIAGAIRFLLWRTRRAIA